MLASAQGRIDAAVAPVYAEGGRQTATASASAAMKDKVSELQRLQF